MNKKGQTDTAMGVSIRTLFNIMLFIVIMGIAFKLIYGAFIKKDPISTREKDLRRITAEMADLMPGDHVVVPVLTKVDDDYEVLVFSTQEAIDSRINKCRLDQGNYCSCLRKRDTIETCISFKIYFDFDSDFDTAELDIDKGVVLDFTNEEARLTSGS